MLFALLKKDFLIVKKYVLLMAVVAVFIPPFMRWRVPEFMGTFGFILSVIFSVFMLLQYISIKEYQYPKAATLLCATPFSRKEMVLSKYIFAVIIITSPIFLPLLMRTVSPHFGLFFATPPYLFYTGAVLIGSAFLSIKIYEKADLA